MTIAKHHFLGCFEQDSFVNIKSTNSILATAQQCIVYCFLKTHFSASPPSLYPLALAIPVCALPNVLIEMLGVSESRIAGSQGPDFSVPRLHLKFKCLPLNILTAIEAKHRAS